MTTGRRMRIFCGMLAGLAGLPLLAIPATEDFENDPASRWNRIDGTYWQITKSAASGKAALSRVLYAGTKPAARPIRIAAANRSPVDGAFDGAVRASLSGRADTPVRVRLDMIFYDAAGKETARREFPLTAGYEGRYVRTVFRVEPPAGAAACRPVLCVQVASPLGRTEFARFDDLEFAGHLAPEPAVREADNTLDLQTPKLDLAFDHGASGWSGIDGKRWRITGSAHSGKGALRCFTPASAVVPADTAVRSVVPVPVRGGTEYRFEARIRASGANIAQTFVKFTFRDASGKIAGETSLPPQYPPGGRFGVLSGVVRTPADAVAADVTLGAHFTAAPGKSSHGLDFDTIRFELWQDRKPAVPPYGFRMADPDSGKWTSGDLAIGKFYRADRMPFDVYADDAANAWTLGRRLTDGRRGGTAFEKSAYVGWRGPEPIALTLDLGRVQRAEFLRITGRRDREAYFAVPEAWRAETSVDGTTYSPWLEGKPKDTPDGMFELTGKSAARKARFVRVTLTPRGEKNVLTLLDEVEVAGQMKNSWKMVPADGVYHGAFPPTYGFKEPWRGGRKEPMSLATFEKIVGKKVSMVLWYQGMSPERNFGELQDLLNIDLMERMRGPRFLSLGWLPPAAVSCSAIAAGAFDAYFIEYFRDALDPAKTLNNRAPIWFRPMNEFNSGWVSWGFEPEAFRAAWRRIYNIAEQLGAAERHIFVWAPNHRSYPDAGWNKMERYYPGDQYVDWVGLSCYPPSPQYAANEGDRYPIGRCREVYAKYGDRKPMMVAEGGYSDACDRVRWVREWFEVPEKYPNFKAMIWENHNTRVLQGSGEALELYKTLVRSPKWIGDLYGEGGK